MRLKLKKINDINELEINQTILRKSYYPATIECIDGNNGEMSIHLRSLFTKQEYHHLFVDLKGAILDGEVFQIIQE